LWEWWERCGGGGDVAVWWCGGVVVVWQGCSVPCRVLADSIPTTPCPPLICIVGKPSFTACSQVTTAELKAAVFETEGEQQYLQLPGTADGVVGVDRTCEEVCAVWADAWVVSAAVLRASL
jgi:hypothetical protein